MRKKFVICILIFILAVVFILAKLITNNNSDLSLSKDDRIKYMNIVDSVSRDKIQINWREVLAIDATINNGKVKNSTEENIKNIAKKFIKEEGNTYKLNSMENVVRDFSDDKGDIASAKKYLNFINESRELSKGHKKDFIDEVREEALRISKESGILPSVVIGQAALESNWGRSELSSDYNNLFGIKADSSWKGEKVNISTKENFNTQIKDDFRVYKSKSESINDFGKFLSENPRYKKAGVFKKKTYKEQIKCIEDAGYSTIEDENGNKVYADYVIDIILSNELQLLDWELGGGKN